MRHHESTWIAGDGVKVYQQVWEPDDNPRAVVCLVHGLGEHSGRYTDVAARLAESGYGLITCDLHGHGQTEGKRGLATLEAILLDIDQLRAEAAGRYPGKPIFLYGHSMGGLLVLAYTLRRKPDLRGVISSSPGLRSVLEDQKLKIAVAKLLGTAVPAFTLPTGLDSSYVSRDPEVVRRYDQDPLVHDKSSAALAKTMLAIIPWVFEHAAEFQPPLLLMHGSADQIALVEGTQEFARRVPGECTLKIWEGCYHELHNEPEKEQVLAFVLEWLGRHA
jgi:alpha-beta hydrolase superfamily lysophospholipase